MEFNNLKVLQEERKFDWDDISVGDVKLNHSQNFFAKKHFEHERVAEKDLLQQKMNESVIRDSENKENKQDKEIKLENATTPVICKKESDDCEASSRAANTKVGVKQEFPNVASEWSTKKIICSKGLVCKSAVSKSMPPPPQAYLCKDIYIRKREEAARRRAEEERKMREFHSRPAPKFDNYQEREPVYAVTMSVTPQVLKKSREAEEKRRKMLAEWKLRNQPLKFEPRPPTVLKEKPFIPEKKSTIVQQCPFNLHMEKRLQERKHYNEMQKKALEEKKKQEEEERMRLENDRIKELRKATIFKARPNPFKN